MAQLLTALVPFLLAFAAPGQSGKDHRPAFQHRSPTFYAGSPWPRFHQNSLGTGLGVAGGSNGKLRWTFGAGAFIYSSPTIAADGTIYLGSEDRNLYAINPDGSLKWTYATSASISNSPAIGKDGTLYFLGATQQGGGLIALNPDGSFKWFRFDINSGAGTSVTLAADGTIYALGYNGLEAINPDGTLKWSFTTNFSVFTTPVVAPDGTIYFTLGYPNLGSYLYAVAPDGTLKWRITPGSQYSSPAIGSDGTIYFGDGQASLYAINPSGSVKWTFTILSGGFAASPAIGADGTIYVGSYDNNLYAINSDGSEKWAFQTASTVSSSAAIGSDGIIYVGGEDAYFYAIKPDGTLKWSFPTGDVIHSSPAIGADGAVYVGSFDHSLYAFGTVVNYIPVSSLALNPVALIGGTASIGTVTLASPAPAGGASIVSLKSNDPSAIVPASVTVLAGAKTATFPISTAVVTSSRTATITATSGQVSVTASLIVQFPGLNGLTVSPASIVGGTSATGTVTVGAAAPAGGTAISLSSSSTDVVVQPTVTVPAGQTSTAFTITTLRVTSSSTATITATEGTSSKTAMLTVGPLTLASLAVSPASVVGGTSSTGTVALNGLAPTGGLKITLSSSSSDAKPPISVVIAAGASSATFLIKTVSVAGDVKALITARDGAVSQTAYLTIKGVALASLSISPSAVSGGSSTAISGTVTLTGRAPLPGAAIKLSSSNSAVAMVPGSVKVAANASSTSFKITTKAVASSVAVTITASLGSVSQQATLTVQPPTLTSLKLNPTSIKGGSTAAVTGTIGLSGPAPAGGIKVALVSSNSSVATVPGTVSVAAGKTSATFTLKAAKVGSVTSLTITGTLGTGSKTATLTVKP